MEDHLHQAHHCCCLQQQQGIGASLLNASRILVIACSFGYTLLTFGLSAASTIPTRPLSVQQHSQPLLLPANCYSLIPQPKHQICILHKLLVVASPTLTPAPPQRAPVPSVPCPSYQHLAGHIHLTAKECSATEPRASALR